jgi:uncharacterized membrane protein YfcA
MLLTLVLGAVIGCIMGLTGAGGGILAVPVLVFGLHMSMTAAGPIGLLAVGIAAAFGAIAGLRKGIVRYKAAMLIAATGVLLTPLGAWLAHRLDTRVLSVVFALVLLRVAFRSLREFRHAGANDCPRADLPCIRSAAHGRFIWNSQCALRLAGIGSLAGVLSGLLGVGGGFVIVPALQRYTDLVMQSVVATSLAVIALISLAGVTTSVFFGHFDFAAGLPFSAGAIGGMLLGNLLASRFQPRHLKGAFGLICLIVSCALIAKAVT